VITEQELELALSLRSKIKDLKILIGKLESVVISASQNLSNGISVDGNKIVVDDYTRNILVKFKDDILDAHRLKLQKLKESYKEIIESPNDTLRRILEENG